MSLRLFRAGAGTRLLPHLLPGLLLALAVAAAAWPQAGTWTGTGAATGLWAWRDWWFRLLAGDLLAGRTGAGDGMALLLTGGVGPDLFSPVDLYLFSVPSWILGTGLAAWNLKVGMVLAANALAGYLLGYAVARNAWGALVAGAVMAFNPTVLGHVQEGALREALWAFPALFAAGLVRLDEGGSTRRVVLTAGALVGAFLTTWLQGVLALVAAAVLVLAGTLPGLRKRPRQAMAGLAGALLLAGVFYVPLGGAVLQGAYPVQFPASLADPREPRMPGEDRAVHEGSRSVDFLVNPGHPEGLNPLLLALLLLPLARRSRGWYLVAALGFLLVLGPCLRMGPAQDLALIGGAPVPLPFGLLYRWAPGMTWVKSPTWFAPLLYLGLAALGAGNVAALRRWFEDQPLLAPLVAVVVLGVTALDLPNRGTLPLRHVRMETPALYASLNPRVDRMVESPGTGDRNRLDFYQACLGLPVLGGAADRQALPGLDSPAARANRTPADVATRPFTRYLLEPGRFQPGSDPAGDLAALAREGYTHLAVHESMAAGLASGPKTFDRMLGFLTSFLGPPEVGTETIEQFPASRGRLPEAPQTRTWRVALFPLQEGRRPEAPNRGR